MKFYELDHLVLEIFTLVSRNIRLSLFFSQVSFFLSYSIFYPLSYLLQSYSIPTLNSVSFSLSLSISISHSFLLFHYAILVILFICFFLSFPLNLSFSPLFLISAVFKRTLLFVPFYFYIYLTFLLP